MTKTTEQAATPAPGKPSSRAGTRSTSNGPPPPAPASSMWHRHSCLCPRGSFAFVADAFLGGRLAPPWSAADPFGPLLRTKPRHPIPISSRPIPQKSSPLPPQKLPVYHLPASCTQETLKQNPI